MPAPTAPVTPAAAAAPPAAKPGKPGTKKGRKWLWITVAIVVLGAGGGGGWWWWQSRHAAAEGAKTAHASARAPALYFALEPAFVVNLTDPDSVRYLQADLQLMTRDPATTAAFELHAPAIRNRLLLLFGQQSSAQLAQRSGKERLQEAALREVRALLKSEGSPAKVEAVIFTSLVTQ